MTTAIKPPKAITIITAGNNTSVTITLAMPHVALNAANKSLPNTSNIKIINSSIIISSPLLIEPHCDICYKPGYSYNH